MAEEKGEEIPMLGNKGAGAHDDSLNVTADTSDDTPLTSNEVMQSQTNGRGQQASAAVPREMEEEEEDADVQDKKPSGPMDQERQGRNMYFKNAPMRIDYILAWSTEGKPEKLAHSQEARAVFEENLQKEGLALERDEKEGEEIHYLKVHAPYEVLTRYAEILKVRMPVKKSMDLDKIQQKYAKLETPMKAVSTRLWDTMTDFTKKLFTPFQLDPNIVKPIKRRFNVAYSRDKEYLFDIPEDKETYFDNATRSRIVNFILRRKPFSREKEKAYSFGINKMIADGHYTDAYPLHEGHWKPGSADNERKLLFDYWANWRNCFKVQPLDHVRLYFGEKIAIYFAWLGFYMLMLIPASIIGLVVFIYGCAIAGNSYPANEVCDESKNFTMCPLCDYQCPYWKLSAACSHARASRIFDNNATVFFAIFMSFWGTLFLEFWKRKQAALQFKWDLTDFVTEEQPPRPEFLAKLEHITTYKEHPITGIKEPHLPFWRRRFPIYLMSWTAMLFLAFLAIIAVVGVIAYRISTLAALQILTRETPITNSTFIASTAELVYQNASLVTTVTAACINLLIIILLNFIYNRLAFWLTDMECLRTQKEYDDSITLKLFSLQFVNYYSSIIYIAFIKGRMVGRPGKYATLFGGRQEECEAGGCLIELCIQLAIIMTGKQLIVNNIVEILIPKIIKWVKRRIWPETQEQKMSKSPWEKDYKLQPAETTSLFYEYLEMILQFGFLTLFVAAFPLGPLFALINNILEIRFDAVKFTTQLRRPMAERIPDIGVWYSVLYGISRIAVISNAFIIALTSDFIPRLVYTMAYSPTGSLEGYVNHTLSVFNTSHFEVSKRPAFEGSENVELCLYRDFRNPPDSDHPYEYSQMYWHVLAARFAFVVVFENVIVVITGLIAWLIPDVPAKLKLHIRREAYMSNEIIIKTELLRAQGEQVGAEDIERIIEDESQRYRTNELGSMELVHLLQFGFLTLFVAAFPLGPLFALINNILEIRFDAVKFTTQLRRPMAERIPDIGVWYSVLYGISRIAVISNAFIIALTSDFIPRLVYTMAYSPTGSLEGYVNHTLSVFNTSHFEVSKRPAFEGSENVELCLYRDFRNPPDSDHPYEYSQMYWHVLAARFAFVVVFENVIVVITGLIAWLIPDVPAKLKLHIRREAYMSNEIIIKTELLRAQGEQVGAEDIERIIEDESQRYRTNELGSMELVHRKSASPPAEGNNVV